MGSSTDFLAYIELRDRWRKSHPHLSARAIGALAYSGCSSAYDAAKMVENLKHPARGVDGDRVPNLGPKTIKELKREFYGHYDPPPPPREPDRILYSVGAIATSTTNGFSFALPPVWPMRTRP